ncbi:MAG TPA: hypothetical protein VKZ74_04030 [Natronosporangium sp.]|nr:hypothetical protein [Natronosporangium sp.]
MNEARETVAVPAGPGVQPPFAAVPIEGRTARRWLGLGVAAAVLVMCCGIGGVAFGGLLVTMIPALNEQAQRTVGDYLDALAAQNWRRAYELHCDADQQAESLAEFTDRVSEPPLITDYELGSLDYLDVQSDRLHLPAEVIYADGSRAPESFPLVPDPQTGRLEVCENLD